MIASLFIISVTNQYDALIIRANHNGLVAAFGLAKVGKSAGT